MTMQWKNAIRISTQIRKTEDGDGGFEVMVVNADKHGISVAFCRHMRWPLGLGGKIGS